MVARLIHDLSPRRDGSFVPVNCGAIPSELMESEFFGHKKGSFTGAVADKQGLFQQANGGTLFLDEVADLPLAMQVKLLRAIQEKTVRAIGDTKEVPVDIRILSATHKDLNQLVQAGSFRQDLYYRINVIELKLPTLNARRDDIPVLAKHFLTLIADEWQLESPPTLTHAACARLQHHDFAGNVRELRNILERAITLAETSTIDASHLGLADFDNQQLENAQEAIAEVEQNNNADKATLSSNAILDKSESLEAQSIKDNAEKNNVEAVEKDGTQQAKATISPYRTITQHYPSMNAHAAASPTAQPDKTAASAMSEPLSNEAENSENLRPPVNQENISIGQLPAQGLEHYLQEQERQLIITALKQTNWNKTQAAELLGTTFRSLRYRMSKLGIAENQSE